MPGGGSWPGAFPAIVTGEVSGLIVLDIDVKAKVSGSDTLAELGIIESSRDPDISHAVG